MELMVPGVAMVGALLVLLTVRALIQTDASWPAVAAVAAPFTYGVVSDTFVGSSNALRVLAGVITIVGAVWALQTEPNHANLSTKHGLGFPGLVLGLVSLYMVSVNVLLAADSSAIQVLGRLLPPIVWVCIALIVARGHVRISDLALISTGVFGAVCVLALFAPAPWSACSEFKCTGYGQLFHGAFNSENSFARTACLAMILSLALRKKTLLILVWVVGTAVLVTTESRTSQVALVIALAVAFVGAFVARRSPLLLRLAAILLPPAFLGIGLAMVFTASLSQYSNRGTIWMLGRTAAADHWVYGSGIDNWSLHVLARNYTHSEALLLLYGGGAIATALYSLFIFAVIRNIHADNLGVGLGLVALILVLGLLEVVANPAGLDATAQQIVALLIVGSVRGDPQAATEPGPRIRPRTHSVQRHARV